MISILFLSTIISCREAIKTKGELITYVNNAENGLKRERQVNKVTISCTYYPAILQDNKLNVKYWNKARLETGNKAYFILSLARENKELLNQLEYNLYSEMVQVLSFRMNQYVSLVINGKETVAPLNTFFQQTYGLSNANNLLVVFDKSQILKCDEFNIKIKEFGLNLGNILFDYKTRDLLYTDKILN